MKHAPITTLVAVLLMAAVSAAEADDDQPPASANLSQPAQQAQGKLSTSRDLQRSRATPSLAGRRNALNIHRAGDAGRCLRSKFRLYLLFYLEWRARVKN